MPIRRTGNRFVDMMNAHLDPDAPRPRRKLARPKPKGAQPVKNSPLTLKIQNTPANPLPWTWTLSDPDGTQAAIGWEVTEKDARKAAKKAEAEEGTYTADPGCASRHHHFSGKWCINCGGWA